MSILNELKRRNVFRVGIAYAITGWLIAQIAGLAATSFFAPDWVMKMIITILLLGFPIAMVMAWAYEMTPEGLRRDAGDEIGQSASTAKLDRTITIALIAALAYFAYDKFVLDPERDAARLESAGVQSTNTGVAAQKPADTAEAPAQSIAVLPFVNMSSDIEQEYFSEGLSEELLNLLVKIPELQVAARTSSFSYKGKDTRIAQIGEELNVAHVLEGSVRKSGNQVRITVQLIKADNGFHLWSETFDRTLDDIFKVQDEIAAAVVQALKVTMLGEKPEQRTTDPEVYTLYLQGKYFINQGDVESLKNARTTLEKALSIDPDYAPAWVSMNIVYSSLAQSREIPADQGSELSMNAVRKALAIDPDYAVAWAALGYLKRTFEWDWAGAQEAIDKAMLLEPNNSAVMAVAASLANSLGQRDKAIALFERHNALDPLSLGIGRSLSMAYLNAGRFEEAVRLLERILTIKPDHYSARRNLASVYMAMGNFDRAIEQVNLAPPAPLNNYLKANLLFRAGRDSEAQELFDQLKASTDFNNPGAMASIFTASGNFDAAFDWLETAFQMRDSALSFMLSNNRYADLRDDPRYPAFLEKLGLLEYWMAMPTEYGGPKK